MENLENSTIGHIMIGEAYNIILKENKGVSSMYQNIKEHA
mgnify:CR=1 FL=1